MIARYRRELAVAGALGLLLLVLALFAPKFFEPANLRAVAVSNAPVLTSPASSRRTEWMP